METPSSSTRRITRSQTSAAISNNTSSRKMEDSEKGLSRPKTGNQDGSALIDITNDSPIVGLASGRLKTPNSWVAKQSSLRYKRTPGSGEALLRSQVKTLLLRVEKEAAPISKFSLESFCPHNNLKVFTTNDSESQYNKKEEFEVENGMYDEQEEREKDVITRTLFLDISEKSDCSSALTEQGTEERSSSRRSIQVNASTQNEEYTR